MGRLSLRESGRCVALVALKLKDLLRRINCCDRVPLSRVTVGFLLQLDQGDLVFSPLNLGQVSFNVEARSLFPYSVYEEEGEGAHRLDVPMNHSSS